MAVPINNTYWAEMVMGRNGSGSKMSSHRQMTTDSFILKFSLVSGFHRHSLNILKLRTPFLFA